MRCEEIREIIDDSKDSEFPTTVREHLTVCSACAEYARGWRPIRRGFLALAEEEVPEASLGFVARLTRRLEEASEESRNTSKFLEQVGRRYVYATLALTLTLALSLVLPPSGPWRGPATPEVYLAQPEMASLENDPLFSESSPDSQDNSPVTSNQEGEKTQQ